uniref:Uncharacterized protein n=1 Tax=Rhizophora mucronata TaxID=61149 RepID=A0A2P2JJD1_RHIMU
MCCFPSGRLSFVDLIDIIGVLSTSLVFIFHHQTMDVTTSSYVSPHVVGLTLKC